MNAFIVEMLAQRYRTVAAFDGRQGLERARELEPDLIVSDIMMPRMSGDQMVREVRSDDRLDGIPILLLTARADDDLRLELLREGAQDYVMKPFHTEEMVSRMSSTMERLTHLIESLLHRASIESGGMVLSEQRVDPAALAGRVVEEMGAEAERRGLELRLEAPPDLDALQTDPQILRLILANLVRNALSYTNEGHVELRLDRVGDHHHFSIIDTGPGIAPEERVRLFAPFERGADARKRQLPGAGLGLALVRDLTEALGGTIELESEVGAGSSFTVILPTAGKSH